MSTIAQPRDQPRTVNALVMPPGLILNGAALAMFVVALWRGSERTGDLGSIMLVAGAWFFVLLAWLFRFVAGAGAGTVVPATARRWAFAPSLFVIAGLLAFGGFAMSARFALSEGALDQAATAAAGGQVVAQGWVGLYPVASMSIEEGTVRIDVSGQYAFVRDAPANVETSSPIWYVPVHGRWSYEVDASFID